MYHQFALLLYACFLLGVLLANIGRASVSKLVVTVAIVTAAVILIKLLVPGTTSPEGLTISIVLTSLRMTEINRFLRVVALLLCVFTAGRVDCSRIPRTVLVMATFCVGITFAILGMPVLLLWIVLCFIKALYSRDWPGALVVVSTAAFPMSTGTGSPTYSLFALIACAWVASQNCEWLESKINFIQRPYAVAFPVIALALLVTLRLGINVPVVSKLVSPVLAERERTFQLERIIDWYMQSPYRRIKVVFAQAASSPAFAEQVAIDRRFRAPTMQNYLDDYLKYLRGVPEAGAHLRIGFGGQPVLGGRSIYRVKSKYAGDAVVYYFPTQSKRCGID